MLNLTQIEDSVIALVAKIIKTTVNRDGAAGTLSEWDSLAQMKIIIQLEKTYNIEIEDEDIAKLKEKHYTTNREWRYNFNAGEMRSYQELVDRRETTDRDAVTVGRGKVDQTLIQRAMEAERKMKRLRMAKYSNELFDEIVKR